MKLLTFEEICEICRYRQGKECTNRTLSTLAAENVCPIIHRFKEFNLTNICKDCRDS